MNNNIQESQDQLSRFQIVSNTLPINDHTKNGENGFTRVLTSDSQSQIGAIFTRVISTDKHNTNIDVNSNTTLPRLSSLESIIQAPQKSPSSDVPSVSGIKEPEQPLSTFKARIPIEDVLALREFLRQVDLRHYGFHREDQDFIGSNVPPSHASPKPLGMSSSSSILLNSPRSGSEYQNALRIRSGRMDGEMYSSGHEDDDNYTHGDFDIVKNAPILRQHHAFMGGISVVPSSPLKPIRPASPRNGSSHIPYKGKFGPNPKCASCHTTKTPYWRDAWNQGILLCNACGLRFAKFKRRCTQCHYVPRKEDKGSRFCPMCKGLWTQ